VNFNSSNGGVSKDIEWESNIEIETHKRIIENAHRHQKQIIVSYHNFLETPPLEDTLMRLNLNI
jgi:3-dehydroquinate dehydratase